jgi:hypothetical protein
MRVRAADTCSCEPTPSRFLRSPLHPQPPSLAGPVPRAALRVLLLPARENPRVGWIHASAWINPFCQSAFAISLSNRANVLLGATTQRSSAVWVSGGHQGRAGLPLPLAATMDVIPRPPMGLITATTPHRIPYRTHSHYHPNALHRKTAHHQTSLLPLRLHLPPHALCACLPPLQTPTPAA